MTRLALLLTIFFIVVGAADAKKPTHPISQTHFCVPAWNEPVFAPVNHYMCWARR